MLAAPPTVVAGVLRCREAVAAALAACGHQLHPGPRLLAAGDVVAVRYRILPGVRVPLRARIERLDADGFESRRAGGPLRALHHRVDLRPEGRGTRVVDEVRWTSPLGPLGRLADTLVVHRLVRTLATSRAAALAEHVAALAGGRVVVAAALLDGGRVLAAQRSRPAELAGRWELPGGRVEPGESEIEAVARECAEELGVRIHVGARIGTDVPLDAGVLRVYTATLSGRARPVAGEHAALRWVGPVEFAHLDWLDADRAVLRELAALLEAAGDRTAPG